MSFSTLRDLFQVPTHLFHDHTKLGETLISIALIPVYLAVLPLVLAVLLALAASVVFAGVFLSLLRAWIVIVIGPISRFTQAKSPPHTHV